MTDKTAEFPKVRCSRHGNMKDEGYSVQARYAAGRGDHKVIGGLVLTGDWKDMAFQRGTPGVSAAAPHSFLHVCGLLTFQAAEALRWWLHAEAAGSDALGDLCVETRLIRHEIALDYEVVAVEPLAEVAGAFRRARRRVEPAPAGGENSNG